MIWIILIAVVAFVIIKFSIALNKDNDDLQGKTLAEKFAYTVNDLNDCAFNGRGKVIPLDKRAFNLYDGESNQIIKFYYSTGHLTIEWRYKYFQQEVVHSRQFNDVRNINVSGQERIAASMIQEMQIVVANHKRKIDGTSIPESIMKDTLGISEENWNRAGELMKNPEERKKAELLLKYFSDNNAK
jgi:hypothetical protein